MNRIIYMFIGVIKIGQPHYFGLRHGDFVNAKVAYNSSPIKKTKHDMQVKKKIM